MKKITIVLDGVADRPNEKLNGKTPLEYANTPNLDALAAKSKKGLVRTIPGGMEIGSAVANLSLLGFDPSTYRGRAVIEAAGLDMDIDNDAMYVRANMVAFSGDNFEESAIKSYSAYDIPTEKAQPIAEELRKLFPPGFELNYCGSFRNILVVRGGKALYPIDFMAAHDIIGQPIKPFIKIEGKEAEFFDIMREAYDFLKGKNTGVDGLWFWGASITPDISGDVTGRVALSETLLMDGITKISGIVNIGTEREGRSYGDFLAEKLQKALRAAGEYEDIYLHFQETDDLSHELMPIEKAKAIESFDRVFLPEFLSALCGDYTISVASDHFTFSDTGAHGGEPVPFLFYDSTEPKGEEGRFTENGCAKTGLSITAKELRGMGTGG